MAAIVGSCIRKRARLLDRESGEAFRVASIGQRYVRYRALRGSTRGVVLRELLNEAFEVVDVVDGQTGSGLCSS
ncbi:hypothetical protein WK77_16510 [Burkholderia ubonensis]|nr:hypothetical protein WK77_16510 [Burkholderia ubonensis]